MSDKPGIRYNCAENDNHFYFVEEEGESPELWIGDGAENSWTIIGLGDLTAGLAKAGYDLRKV